MKGAGSRLGGIPPAVVGAVKNQRQLNNSKSGEKMSTVLRLARMVPPTGELKAEETKPFWERMRIGIKIAVRALYGPQPMGVAESHAVGAMIRPLYGNLFDTYQARKGAGIGKGEKKLESTEDYSRRSALANAAIEHASNANETVILHSIEKYLATGQLTAAWEYLQAGKATGKITGYENGDIEARLWGLLGLLDVLSGIREWTVFGNAVRQYQDICIDTAVKMRGNVYAKDIFDPLAAALVNHAKIADPQGFAEALQAADTYMFSVSGAVK